MRYGHNKGVHIAIHLSLYWMGQHLLPSSMLWHGWEKMYTLKTSFKNKRLKNSFQNWFEDEPIYIYIYIAAASKSLQSCPTLCDPIDGSPPGSPVPGILQARTLEWVAISFSNAWKWQVKVKSLSRVPDPQRLHGLQPSRLLCHWDFPGKSTGAGCHCLLRYI